MRLKVIIVSSFLLLASVFSLNLTFSQSGERFFDTAGEEHQDVRLVVLYPSVSSIKALVALKQEGLFSLENTTVIGVFHEKEKTDYLKSIEFVRENSLERFQFHRVSAEISGNDLFKNNACSLEFEDIFKKSDGIIFFGGPDIPPSLYGKKTSLLTEIEDPFRHFFELSFIFHLLGGHQDEQSHAFIESKPGFPILGICLGCQSLNVGTGGNLYQDIWSECYGKTYLEDVIELGRENWHTNPYARLHQDMKLFPYHMHSIKLAPKGKFCREMGFTPDDTPSVLSAHHQALDGLGKGLHVIATSPDGKVVEAVEHDSFPNVLGVQFHPEFPVLWEKEPNFILTPQDMEKTSLKCFLEKNPPSLEFHKKIWAWFSQKLQESHAKYAPSRKNP